MNRKIIFSFVLSTVLLLTCCSQKKQSLSNPVFLEITDSYNREIVLTKEPNRIISLSPGITEVIYALESEKKLIGRCEFCNYPDTVCEIPTVGGINNVNVEKIVSLSPDLVIISSIVPRATVEMLEQINIPVISLRAEEKFTNLFTIIETMGMILNEEQKAFQLIEKQKQKLHNISLSFENLKENRPTVYYVVGYGKGGDYTPGGNTFINDIILLAGAKNIAEANTTWSYSREQLFSNQPEYIFIRSEDFENFCRTFPYSTLLAVNKGRVYPIESSLLDVQGPRNIEAIQYIAEKIKGSKK